MAGQGWTESIAQRRVAPLMRSGVGRMLKRRVGGSGVSARRRSPTCSVAAQRSGWVEEVAVELCQPVSVDPGFLLGL